MKVKLSLNDVVLLYEELNGRVDYKGQLIMKGLRYCGPMSGLSKLYLNRLSNQLKSEYQNYKEVDNQLIKENGEERDDEFTIVRFERDETGRITNKETAKWKFYQEEISSLLKTEYEYEINDISSDIIKDIVFEENCDYPIFFSLID